MSLNSLLGSARLALLTQQAAMETTSHNIANAQTPGYTRQRADLVANTPLYLPQGALGTGVIISNISRSRDALLDINYRTQSSHATGADTRSSLLDDISTVYAEPSDSAFAATLDQFWGAWSDLANNPTNAASKSVVQQRGAQVANTLNRYDAGLTSVDNATRVKLQTSIDTLNRYSTQVGQLNGQIVAAESGGHTAGDLRDTRDNIIDQMSALAPTQVIENKDGSVNVYMGNTTVVDGVVARSLTVGTNAGKFALQVKGTNSFMPPIGGSISAMMDVINVDIPNQRSQLNALAQTLITKINSVHRTGWTAVGDALGGANWNALTPPTGSNVDFFDPTKTTAATISLSVNVNADASYIAAGNVQNGTGNTAVAIQLTQLQNDTTSIVKYGSTAQTTSFGEYYRDQVTRLGIATSDAESSAAVFTTLSQQADIARQSANGVSTDEELINMTKHQQAYAAAAKIITAADDMAQSLLDMLR